MKGCGVNRNINKSSSDSRPYKSLIERSVLIPQSRTHKDENNKKTNNKDPYCVYDPRNLLKHL